VIRQVEDRHDHFWPCRADAGLIGVSQISQIITSQDFAGSDFERGSRCIS
jgi:hypothetical protein